MVAANEVRIGNMFILELHSSRGLEYDHYFILTEEWMGKLFGDNISIALQDLFPIPLTPEILEKCGFVKTSYNNHKSNPHIAQEIRDLDFFDHRFNNMVISGVGRPIDFFEVEYCALDIEERTYIAKINYLHQLQNLYYALTNEELTFQQQAISK